MRNQLLHFLAVAVIVSGCSQYGVTKVDPLDKVNGLVDAISVRLPATELALFEDIPIVLTSDLKL